MRFADDLPYGPQIAFDAGSQTLDANASATYTASSAWTNPHLWFPQDLEQDKGRHDDVTCCDDYVPTEHRGLLKRKYNHFASERCTIVESKSIAQLQPHFVNIYRNNNVVIL